MEGKDVSKSNISQLFPYIDDNGYMRARGRIFIADFEFDTKHPTVPPNYYHGVDSMWHELQQKF